VSKATELRSSISRAIGTWLRSVKPDKKTLRRDLTAGVPGAIASVPDGMAASVLIGVSPIHGLWAATIGRLVGGVSTSSQLMIVTTTSAAALAAGSSLSSISAADKPSALFMLTLIAGVLMVLSGVFKLSKYVRFVPHSVMLGFLSGVAINIVLSQLTDLTGVSADGSTSLSDAIQVISHPQDIVWETLLMGVLALAILVGADRTPPSGATARSSHWRSRPSPWPCSTCRLSSS
jgi:SulP family sulfate permease